MDVDDVVYELMPLLVFWGEISTYCLDTSRLLQWHGLLQNTAHEGYSASSEVEKCIPLFVLTAT